MEIYANLSTINATLQPDNNLNHHIPILTMHDITISILLHRVIHSFPESHLNIPSPLAANQIPNPAHDSHPTKDPLAP